MILIPINLKNKNIAEIEKSIKNLQEKNENDITIQAMETQLKIAEETNYQNSFMIYEVDEDGYLTTVRSETTILPNEEEQYTMVSISSLTEYNNESTEGLIPQID